MDLRPFYEKAAAGTREVVQNVKPDQLAETTPCADWNVRELINHMIRGNKRFAANGRGEAFEASQDQDFTGADAAAAFDASVDEAIAGFNTPGAMDRMFDLPFGQMPGVQAVRIALLEAVVHGWDVAKATGQDTTRNEILAGQMLSGLKQMVPGGKRQPGMPFGDEVEVAEDATDVDKLVAYLGRTP